MENKELPSQRIILSEERINKIYYFKIVVEERYLNSKHQTILNQCKK